MVAVAATARLFAQRPSTLLAIEEPMTALAFDLAAAACLNREREGEARPPVNRIYV